MRGNHGILGPTKAKALRLECAFQLESIVERARILQRRKTKFLSCLLPSNSELFLLLFRCFPLARRDKADFWKSSLSNFSGRNIDSLTQFCGTFRPVNSSQTKIIVRKVSHVEVFIQFNSTALPGAEPFNPLHPWISSLRRRVSE